jgi:hypothetical protein
VGSFPDWERHIPEMLQKAQEKKVLASSSWNINVTSTFKI